MSRRYIAFLRAINVGGRTVKMLELRKLFEAMGFAEVETFIASGNVIFVTESGTEDSDRTGLEARIEAGLAGSLGYHVETFLRTPQELGAILGLQPFGAREPDEGTLYVGFLKQVPTPETADRVEALSTATDLLKVHGCELYWLGLAGMAGSSTSAGSLEKVLGPTTVRNTNTVRRLSKKYPAG